MNQMVVQSLLGVGWPAVAVLIAGALWFVICREHPRVRAIGIGLIIAGGIVWAYQLAFGGLTYPPREPGQWIPYLAIIAALVGCLQCFRLGRQPWNFALSLATALVFFWSQIPGNLLVLLWVLALTILLFVSTILLQQLIEDRSSGAELALGLAITAGAGGVASFLGGSAILGQISGALGLMLGAVAVLAFFFNATVGTVVPLIYLLVFGTLLLSGCLFAQLPWLTAILLWVAPWALIFGQRSDQPRISRRAGVLGLRILGVVILVALALGSAFLLAPPSSEL
jgi:hypothetical protein